MLTKYRNLVFCLIVLFVTLNVFYFTDVIGSQGVDIIRTVKVKATAVKEGTTALGSDVFESVKSWTLWDPLEWADDGEGEDEDSVVGGGDDEDEYAGADKPPAGHVELDSSNDPEVHVDGDGDGDAGVLSQWEEDRNKLAEDKMTGAVEFPTNNVNPDDVAVNLDDAVSLLADAAVLEEEAGALNEDGGALINDTSTADGVGEDNKEDEAEIKDDDTENKEEIKDDISEDAKSEEAESEAAKPNSGHRNKKPKHKKPNKEASNEEETTELVQEGTTPNGDGLSTEVVGDDSVDAKPLTLPQLCDETIWTPGLYLVCHSKCGQNNTSICGGLNNARNRLQTCMRIAIDAGATLILPQAMTRNEALKNSSGLRDINFKSEPPQFFWDIDHLKRGLVRGGRKKRGGWEPGVCKQLKVRDWDDWPTVSQKRQFTLPYREYVNPPLSKGKFRKIVNHKLRVARLARHQISEQNPVMLNWGDSYIGWDYKASNEMGPVRAGLFGILNFNKDVLALGESVLDSPELRDGFIGIHLRGEQDWPSFFGSFPLQMKLYIKEIRLINRRKKAKNTVKTLYVSCGDQEAVEIFRQKVKKELGEDYVVVDKWSLLAERKELLAQVEALPFDRKAIVEYKTLVEGRFFLGILTSTMSNLIAYARTVDQYADSEEDFFYDVVLKGSVKRRQFFRVWRRAPHIKGTGGTRLLVVNARDIMQRFP